jgi:hypothetical protein
MSLFNMLVLPAARKGKIPADFTQLKEVVERERVAATSSCFATPSRLDAGSCKCNMYRTSR